MPNHDQISELLATTPPFDVTTGSSHFDLVKNFTISKGGRKGFIVYIYEVESNCEAAGVKRELKGSPFSTYGAGHVAIGLKPASRVAGRYIDTGKAYQGRYIFSSIPALL